MNVEENIKEKMVIYGVGFKSQRFFYTIGNFISYRIKTSGGSHCGGKEDVAYATRRRRRIPQAGFFLLRPIKDIFDIYNI